MGTKVKVTNLHNGKSEIVKISDRGPYTKGRIIDVTVGVAERLGFKKNGVAKVKVEVVGKVKTK
jgi:rare lipoprotein A